MTNEEVAYQLDVLARRIAYLEDLVQEIRGRVSGTTSAQVHNRIEERRR